MDVTLAAEGRQLQAHKVVLSACSSYFQVSDGFVSVKVITTFHNDCCAQLPELQRGFVIEV